MSRPYTLTLATPSDAFDLATVHVTAWHHAYSDIIPPEKLATLQIPIAHEQWKRRLAAAAPRNHILRVEGRPAGFTTTGAIRDVDSPEDMGEILSIYLTREYWGQGWGRILMDVAVRDLLESGYSQAGIWVLSDNHRARGFYEHLGFSPDGTQKNVTVCGDVTLPEVRYLKRIKD